jgi:hypothetical protein
MDWPTDKHGYRRSLFTEHSDSESHPPKNSPPNSATKIGAGQPIPSAPGLGDRTKTIEDGVLQVNTNNANSKRSSLAGLRISYSSFSKYLALHKNTGSENNRKDFHTVHINEPNQSPTQVISKDSEYIKRTDFNESPSPYPRYNHQKKWFFVMVLILFMTICLVGFTITVASGIMQTDRVLTWSLFGGFTWFLVMAVFVGLWC